MKDTVGDYIKQQENTPAERWRKPAIPVNVENDVSQVSHDGNRLRTGYQATFDAETIERFRLGYLCLRCWEPHQIPFPASCSLCGYAMKENQARDFQTEYEGTKWIGPTTSLGEEYERMIEDGHRRRHHAGASVLIQRPSGLIVPSDAS